MSARVYSYVRFSDPRQAGGSSSDRQTAYAARWAAEHGLVLDDTLSLRDEGLSAYHQRHVKTGALGVFMGAVEAGKVPSGSVLVVEGLDRLSRAEPIQAQAQLTQIINAGITVVTASDGKSYSRERLKNNPMDLIYSLLVMIRAHEESDTKSKRVKASIRRACEGWMAGTYRGVIRNGKDPMWVRQAEDGTYQLIPEKVASVHLALDLYRKGYGSRLILDELKKKGLRLGEGSLGTTLQIYRVVRQKSLMGVKELEVDGQQFNLPGYYPALLTELEFNELQSLNTERGRRRTRGDLPNIVTGIGVSVCGYCGGAMVGQNLHAKAKAGSTHGNALPQKLLRGYRRLHCHREFASIDRCPQRGSTSVVPLEVALFDYCSDILNLKALHGGDLSTEPRARLAAARENIAALQAKLDRLTDMMLEASDGSPATWARKAVELEQQITASQAEATRAEHDLAQITRIDLTGADLKWQGLREKALDQDIEARLLARQLVADTFERIIVWRFGIRPEETPKGSMDVLLIAKGGATRSLRIDKNGGWRASEDGIEAAG